LNFKEGTKSGNAGPKLSELYVVDSVKKVNGMPRQLNQGVDKNRLKYVVFTPNN